MNATKVRDATALESALATHKRVGEYEQNTLSANEWTILVLGDEVQRLARIVQRHPAARRDAEGTPRREYGRSGS